MSLSSTPTLKSHLSTHLGPTLSKRYFRTLNEFFNGRISRDEFDEGVRSVFRESIIKQKNAPLSNGVDSSTTTAAPAAAAVAAVAPEAGVDAQVVPPGGDDKLIQIHNALIISLFDATTHHKRSGLLGVFQQQNALGMNHVGGMLSNGNTLTNGMDDSSLLMLGNGTDPHGQPPPRKRRRVMRGNGAEEDQLGTRSDRLTKWVIGLGRPERERIKKLPNPALPLPVPVAAPPAPPPAVASATTATANAPPAPVSAVGGPTPNEAGEFSDWLPMPNGTGVNGVVPQQPQTYAPTIRSMKDLAEVNMERGVILINERDDPPGSRLPLQLCSLTRTPTLPHICERVNLISSQHDLLNPTKDVGALLMLALEFKLKQLVTHALTLTHAGLAINSITALTSRNSIYGNALSNSNGGILNAKALDTLFTISPADLPQRSAVVTARLAVGEERDDDEDAHLVLVKDREVSDQRWQLVALMAERSAVREGLQMRPRGG